MFKLQGIIKLVSPIVQVSEKFTKREFVVTDNSSMYPQDIMFQLTQDRCNLIEGFQANDQVEVSFNIRGREWTSPQGEVKYFNTLDAWRIDKVNISGTGIPISGPSAMNLDPIPTSNPELTVEKEDDDLPF